MEGKTHTVFGVFRTRKEVDTAVHELMRRGFGEKDIGKRRSFTLPHSSPEFRWGGATAGAIIGGTVGLAAGLGIWALPVAGTLLLAGPITGTVIGSAVGALSGHVVLDHTEEDENEETLLSIHPEDTDAQGDAIKAFEQSGASDVFVEGSPITAAEKDILQFRV